MESSGRLIGKGIVTGWNPFDLEIKDDIENDLIYQGWTGMALENESRRQLVENWSIRPNHVAFSFNTMVNGGTAIILDGLIGAGITAYNNANAALGAGDSAAAFALSQTNLQGAVNTTDRVRKAMDATFPSRSANVLTFRSTFATTDANFTWNEWALFNNVTDGSGTMLNRAVTNLGTKTSASSWQLTATFTQS